jgi:predicted aminopeptidase
MTLRAITSCLVAVAGLMTACAGPGYYLQAAGGHLRVMTHTRAIDDILADSATPAPLKSRLTTALEARDFASRTLGLPDNRSYRRYVDVPRRHMVWSVYATPALALDPLRWCFPVAGCVAYRGYFAQQDAERFARHLRKKGYDVYVAGVDAYSTLGWFSDPLPSPVLRRSDTEVAGVIFHELAHQRLYISNDSAFNESFARTVELEGMRRWLSRACTAPDCDTTGPLSELADYLRDKARHDEFIALLKQARDRLQRAYQSGLPDTDKLTAKTEIFAWLQTEYRTLRATWDGYAGYDRWFAQDLNNAHLASIDTYYRHVAGFQALLQTRSGDLPAFYAASQQLGRMSRDERAARLRALACIRLAGGSGQEGGDVNCD